MPAPPTDYDSPWKEALDGYFADFLGLLAPWLHEQIDWAEPAVFLDKELQAITRAANSRRRYADKLVRVQHKMRRPFWILIHIEVQAGGLQACSVHFRFPVVHLASWLGRWNELGEQAAKNPFAVVVMAQLQAQQTRKNSVQRLASKIQIGRLMYRHQYSRTNILQLIRLIDWMMALPPELEPAFEQAMITIEQEHKMAFVTSIERLGEKRGLEKGLAKGLREGESLLLQRQLIRKFGPLSEAHRQRIWTATSAQLEAWSLNILDAESLDDVFTE